MIQTIALVRVSCIVLLVARGRDNILDSRARGYKTFAMLNSVEHEILNGHKYKNIKKFNYF